MIRPTITLLLTLTAPVALATETIEMSGEELFDQYCAACHGESGQGDGPVASVMSQPVPDLTRIAQRRDGDFPREMIKNAIDGRWRIEAHGSQQMPVWGYEFWITEGAGDFSEVEVSKTLDRLVNYLEYIQVAE
jgi:mono/diheme cytochrome c family protein